MKRPGVGPGNGPFLHPSPLSSLFHSSMFYRRKDHHMHLFHQPPDPGYDYARAELRALLDRGIDPLIAWVRNDLASAPPQQGFHATSSWDNNILACYLSHFLPKLPPTDYWQQDVVVIHHPEHWENACYNRIFTQYSGNCLIPDDFHDFLLRLTRAFGNSFITVRALIYWLDHGTTLEHAVWDEDVTRDQRLLASIALAEAQEGGTIDRSTITVLQHFGTLEWLGILALARRDHHLYRALHVKGEYITTFGGFCGGEAGDWFSEMQDRGYLSRFCHRRTPKPSEESGILDFLKGDHL